MPPDLVSRLIAVHSAASGLACFASATLLSASQADSASSSSKMSSSAQSEAFASGSDLQSIDGCC